MKRCVKEELNSLIEAVERSIINNHREGNLTYEEYEKLDDARADLYITLDMLREEK